MRSNMTIEKMRDMLLEDKRRKVEKNGNKTINTIALVHYNFNN